MLEHVTAMMVRTFARAGYEWLWIDNEHGHQSYETIYHAARTAEGVGIASIMRVTSDDYGRIAQALDMGVTGSSCRGGDAGAGASHYRCAKYPPVGKRVRDAGVVVWRAQYQHAGPGGGPAGHAVSGDSVGESAGVENLEKIIEVAEGQLDGIFMVEADYQMVIGKPDCPDDPEVVGAARHIAACRPSTICRTEHAKRRRSDGEALDRLGFNMITYKSDEQFLADAAYEGGSSCGVGNSPRRHEEQEEIGTRIVRR